MIVERSGSFAIRVGEDVVRVRQAVRAEATAIGLSLVDQTKIITAASEIARNAIDHAGGGELCLDVVSVGNRRGVRLVFSDQGPGIPDIARALTDGYTTGGGLGLGLSGAKRLSNEFDLQTTIGKGTIITLIRWK